MLIRLGTATASWLGHLLGKIGQWLGAPPPDSYGHITEYRSNPIVARMRLSGIVFGNVVLYSVGDPAIRVPRYDRCGYVELREHEWAHVAQYRGWGALFWLKYGLAECARPFTASRINRYEMLADDSCRRSWPAVNGQKIARNDVIS
ncbi:MAG: hypothetical protein ACOX5J_18085 [Candidatus Hydrogenedentales bacterium]|jgi:hypothetical protein